MKRMHGGDIYRNHVEIDFSVNLNPLGMPETVKAALYKAVGDCDRYPDREAESLKRAVAQMLSAPEDYLLFGNGASELFLAIVHAVKPRKTVIPVPSFYGYEYAAKAVGGEIVYQEMKPEEGFAMADAGKMMLNEETDLLFLANPNNPTGKLLEKKALLNLLQHCKEKEILVVLDECFIEFCGREFSLLSEIERFENLLLVGAFTKIFSIPGVRLGYLLCSDTALLTKIKRQLPEWNLSVLAQEAGCACAGETDFLRRTIACVRKERAFLEEGLNKLGFRVYPSAADFILFYSEEPLYEKLLKRGILIRDCADFRGLGRGFYRIAVKSREENERLLREMSFATAWKGKDGKE
ncbi:MAG: aminotransferase class I/II-fold pyridoxal phosphate-dependent enzyme [Roseburia sp.]|nr:aminotransferase class I/II-fold pyridoxal phosphate-dependent enzyme [Roseburia sp.]MCM1241793.1 aminotransferase class I/II-fold pyridoxal phosphate-dependent enzyme [Roseburia sp.]